MLVPRPCCRCCIWPCVCPCLCSCGSARSVLHEVLQLLHIADGQPAGAALLPHAGCSGHIPSHHQRCATQAVHPAAARGRRWGRRAQRAWACCEEVHGRTHLNMCTHAHGIPVAWSCPAPHHACPLHHRGRWVALQAPHSTSPPKERMQGLCWPPALQLLRVDPLHPCEVRSCRSCTSCSNCDARIRPELIAGSGLTGSPHFQDKQFMGTSAAGECSRILSCHLCT